MINERYAELKNQRLVKKIRTNIPTGCVYISHSVEPKDLPEYNHKDQKIRVIFKTATGEERSFVMSSHHSGQHRNKRWLHHRDG